MPKSDKNMGRRDRQSAAALEVPTGPVTLLFAWLIEPHTALCLVLGIGVVLSGVGVATIAESMRDALAAAQGIDARRLAAMNERSLLINEVGAFSSLARIDADAHERLGMHVPSLTETRLVFDVGTAVAGDARRLTAAERSVSGRGRIAAARPVPARAGVDDGSHVDAPL